MNKKTYVAPVVKRVDLNIKNAILAACHQSPTYTDPQEGPAPCAAVANCYNPV